MKEILRLSNGQLLMGQHIRLTFGIFKKATLTVPFGILINNYQAKIGTVYSPVFKPRQSQHRKGFSSG